MAEIDDTKQPKRRGRPEGSTNRYTKQAIEQAMATGMLPHEILLDMARGNPQKEFLVNTATGKVTEQWVSLDIEQRKDAAKAAAPYYAPKISTVEVIRNVEDAELDWLIAELAAQTGLTAGAEREAEADEDSGGESGGAEPRPVIRRKLLED